MTGAGRLTPAPRPSARLAGSGFTLAEVLVAMSVLAVGFLGMITVLWAGYGDISQSGRETAAAAAARSLVEKLRNQLPTDLPALNGMTTDNPSRCPGAVGSRLNTLCRNWSAQVAQLPRGRGTVAVAQIPHPATGVILHRITITVSWTEANRGGRQLTLVAGRSD